MITTVGRFEIDDDPRAGRPRRGVAVPVDRGLLGAHPQPGRLEAQLDEAWRLVAAYDGDGATVGFARAVSDGVNFAYLADVYVEAVARGAGLGTALVRAMVEDGPGRAFRWTLFTQDAHGLYARFGFAAPDATAMVRPRGTGVSGCARDRPAAAA